MEQFSTFNSFTEATEENVYIDGTHLILLDREEWNNYDNSDLPHKKVLTHHLSQLPCCRGQLLSECILGTLLIPQKKEHITSRLHIGFYITKNVLFFIGEKEPLMHLLGKARKNGIPENINTIELFCLFLNIIIDEDVFFLQKLEETLSHMEEEILKHVVPGFYHNLSPYRKELRTLHAYYYQLINLSSTLRINTYQMFDKEDDALFGYFQDRVEHLGKHVDELREYVMQIREIHQTQLDLQQTKTINLLTVVSAIFLPLTLITGWYGMNFVNMPELHWAIGYGCVFLLSVIIVIIEIWYFKKKKFF